MGYSRSVGSAKSIQYDKLAGSTYRHGQDVQDLYSSAGKFEDGALITDAGSETIDVSIIKGALRTTNSHLGRLKFIDIAATSGIAIPTDSVRWVFAEWNSGTPQVVVRADRTSNGHDEFIIGNVVNEAGTLHISNSGQLVADPAKHTNERFSLTMPFERDEVNKGVIIGESGTRNVTLSAGNIFDGFRKFAIPSLDTSVAGTFDSYLGATLDTAGETQWDNTNYNNGGSKTAMTVNRWTARYWFMEPNDGNVVMVYGEAQYATQAQAEADTIPGTLPDRLVVQGMLLARTIFQNGAGTWTLNENVFTQTFAATASSDHFNLANVGTNTHVQIDTAISASTTHIASDGKDHSDVVLNNTHRASVGTDHSDVGLNNTHRTGSGSDHADVATNTSHSTGDGSDHADVATNSSHSSGDGSDHADVATNTSHSTGDGSDHADVATNSSHSSGNGSDHADVATNTSHSTGDGSDHADVATNSSHSSGDGSDHADVASNTTHRNLTSGNPHSVNLQDAYDDYGSDPALITVDSTREQVRIRDAATPTAGVLSDVTSNDGTDVYHEVKADKSKIYSTEFTKDLTLVATEATPIGGQASTIAVVHNRFLWGVLNGGRSIVYDLHDEANPELIVNYNPSLAFTLDATGDGRFIFQADLIGGFNVIDFFNLNAPTIVGTGGASSITKLIVSGGVVYANNVIGAGIQLINVSDPTNPFSMGTAALTGTALTFAIVFGILYVGSKTSGSNNITLTSYDVRDTKNPVQLDSITLRAAAGAASHSSMDASRRYVVIGYTDSLWVIVNSEDPTNLAQVGSDSSTGITNYVRLKGDRVSVAHNAGLEIFDITDVTSISSVYNLGSMTTMKHHRWIGEIIGGFDGDGDLNVVQLPGTQFNALRARSIEADGGRILGGLDVEKEIVAGSGQVIHGPFRCGDFASNENGEVSKQMRMHGGVLKNIKTKTANYTLVETTDHTIWSDTDGAARENTLPSPANAFLNNISNEFVIKNTGTSGNNAKIIRAASEKINEVAADVYLRDGEAAVLTTDGTDWQAQFINWGHVKIRKDADETVTNSSTLQDDDDLFFRIEPNEIWEYEFNMYCFADSVTPDIKLRVSGPTGSTNRYVVGKSDINLIGGVMAYGTAVSDSTTTTFFALSAITNTYLRISGSIKNSTTAGDVQLEWAQNTATVGEDTKILASSKLVCHRIS